MTLPAETAMPAQKGPRTNRDRWATTEFREWSTERGLLGIEDALVDKYLTKEADTLEAASGGGRILVALRDKGFTSLAGFDYLPEMIQAARASDPAGNIRLDVMEATSLDYPAGSFDQVIFIRLLAAVDTDGGPAAVLREANRVLRSQGIALISFLWWEPRQSHTVVRLMGPWLRMLRALHRADRGPRDWPWLHVGEKPNYGALLDHGPFLHWFTTREAEDLLTAAGFSIVSSGGLADAKVARGDAAATQSTAASSTGELYFVCTKP